MFYFVKWLFFLIKKINLFCKRLNFNRWYKNPRSPFGDRSTLTIHIRLLLVCVISPPGDFRFDSFIPWRQRLQFFIAHLVWLMLKKVGKVMVDVYSICFFHFYHRVYDSTCLRSIWCVAEQSVFPPYSKWANSVFTKVIRKASFAIFKVSCKIGAAVLNIGNCFIHSWILNHKYLIIIPYLWENISRITQFAQLKSLTWRYFSWTPGRRFINSI